MKILGWYVLILYIIIAIYIATTRDFSLSQYLVMVGMIMPVVILGTMVVGG